MLERVKVGVRSLDYILLSSCGFPHGSLFIDFPHESDPQKAAEMALPQRHKYNLAVGTGEEPKLASQWTAPYRVFPKTWGWVLEQWPALILTQVFSAPHREASPVCFNPFGSLH